MPATRQVFPAQLAAATKINETLLEGLQPWQPKKIYYFSDAENQDQFKDTGPTYITTEISPTHNLPYWRLAMDCVFISYDAVSGLHRRTQ